MQAGKRHERHTWSLSKHGTIRLHPTLRHSYQHRSCRLIHSFRLCKLSLFCSGFRPPVAPHTHPHPPGQTVDLRPKSTSVYLPLRRVNGVLISASSVLCLCPPPLQVCPPPVLEVLERSLIGRADSLEVVICSCSCTTLVLVCSDNFSYR